MREAPSSPINVGITPIWHFMRKRQNHLLGDIVDPASAEMKVMSAKDRQSHFDQAKAEAFAGKVGRGLGDLDD